MTIQEQKIILRMLSHQQIADLFPKHKGISALNDWRGMCGEHRESKGWYCTRPNGHDGLHIRHVIYLKHVDLPYVWLQE
jgi:hypothetical protein